MNCPLNTLKSCINFIPQASYPSIPGCIALAHLISPSINCFVKRDDELGFGISGSKIRKYRSLIPWLIQKGIEEVVIIGSSCSNHVLGLSQLLIENKLKPTLFLKGDPSYSLKGIACSQHYLSRHLPFNGFRKQNGMG